MRLTPIITSAALALCALGFGPSLAAADEPPALTRGDRIRVSLAASHPDSGAAEVLTGTLLAIDANTVTVESTAASPPLMLPRDRIAGLEVQVDGRSSGEGAAFGAAVGLGAAGLIGMLPLGDDHGSDLSLTQAGRVFVAALVLVPVGALFGATHARGEHWEQVPASEIGLGWGRTPSGDQGVFLEVGF